MIIKNFILLLLLPAALSAENGSEEASRQHLRKLLQERKDLFGSYTEQAEQKSGIFGNQTKNDLREAQDVLINIVRQDNKIINELENLLNYREFQNLDKSSNLSEYEQRLQRQQKIIDNQSRELKKIKAENEAIAHEVSLSHFYNWLLLGLIILLFFVFFFICIRKKKKA